MSELKVYHHELRHNEYEEFYLKYEADKVIADKDKEISELQAMLEERNRQIGNLDAIAKRNQRAAQTLRKKMNHHKYKRCLTMYHYCAIKALYELEFKGNDVEWKWYSKWMHKWFNLAEKFKEAKL